MLLPPITSIQSSMGKEITPDSTQLLPNRITNLSNSPQFNPRSQLTNKETMPGPMTNPILPMRMIGKPSSKPSDLITLIQLRNRHPLCQILPHLPRSSKRANLLTQLRTATPLSPPINRVSTHGLVINMALAMRRNGAKRLMSLLPDTLIMLTTQDHQDWFQLLQILPSLRRRSIQLKIATPSSPHTPRETMLGPMASTTNLTKSHGQRKPMSPQQTTSTGLSTSKELTLDSTQLFPNNSNRKSTELRPTLSLSLTLLEIKPGT